MDHNDVYQWGIILMLIDGCMVHLGSLQKILLGHNEFRTSYEQIWLLF